MSFISAFSATYLIGNVFSTLGNPGNSFAKSSLNLRHFSSTLRAIIRFGSSNHAIGFYPRHHRIGTDVTARPDSRYGVSKVFGEAVGALYADKHGLKVTCIRIGNFGEKPLDHRRLSLWLKPEDLVQLCRIGLEHPGIHFEIFYGASNNERSWWDNHRAYDLGYRPTGRAEDFREHAFAEQAKLKADPVGDFYQGGTFCGMEFDGDVGRILI